MTIDTGFNPFPAAPTGPFSPPPPSSGFVADPFKLPEAAAASGGFFNPTTPATAGLNDYFAKNTSNVAFNPTSDTTSTTEAADLTPNKDNDVRFQWIEVDQPLAVPGGAANYNAGEYDIALSDQFNEIESRVFALDVMRAGSDTASDIASFRVIAYEYGQINTKKQIFPKIPTSYADSLSSNSSSAAGLLYKKMIIASMGFGYSERSQIIKSNKALHAYFFNDNPEVLSIQGFLKTSAMDPWDIAMVLLWDRLFRGTELARHNGILELAVAGVVYWGYPLSFTPQISANTQYVASFAMQFLVIDKLLPLENMDDAVMGLVTSNERSQHFVTTSQSATNDINITFLPTSPVTTASLDNLPTGQQSAATTLALGQGPLAADAADKAWIDSVTTLPAVAPGSPYAAPSFPTASTATTSPSTVTSMFTSPTTTPSFGPSMLGKP